MGDDSLGKRADDFERRVAEAGSTDAIIGSLVEGASRSHKITKWLVISLVLDIVLSVGFGVLALIAWNNTNDIDQEANGACIQSAKNSVVVNSFLELLITVTKNSTLLTPSEIKTRIDGYEKLIVEIPGCLKDAKHIELPS